MNIILRTTLAAFMLIGVLSCVGCTSEVEATTDEGSELDAGNDNAQVMNQEQVTGTVTSISEAEILIDATDDTGDFLRGAVRVNVSSLDASIYNALKVGDTVIVTWSGMVGMSEPPYISADTIEIQ